MLRITDETIAHVVLEYSPGICNCGQSTEFSIQPEYLIGTKSCSLNLSIKKNTFSYHLIVEEIDDYAVLLLDENGDILDWNKGAEKLKGYKAEEIIGKNFRIFYTEEERTIKLPEQLLQRGALEGRASAEGWRVRKDNSRFWGSILITAIHDEHNKLIGFLKITRDLTERKLMEAKLKEMNSELENKVAAKSADLQKSLKEISDYKYAIDESSSVAITDLNGIIQHVNENFCKTSKYSADELIGQDHRIVNSGYHTKEFFRNLWVTVSSGKIWRGEVRDKKKDGTYYWADTTIVPFLDDLGKPYQYLAIHVDITQRKTAEEEIKRLNRELEERVKQRTEELEAFSYSVSHDLRAPLRAVNGYARVLEEDYNSVFDDEGRRLLKVIQDNAKRMGILIDDLLSFSRLGKKDVVKSYIKMNELFENVLAEINKTVSHHAKINISPLDDVVADRALLNQVAFNLLSNAIKYSAKVKNPAIEVKSSLQSGEIIFSVSDNGVGFDNLYAHKLFGVFQRLHSTEEFEGIGVGLALVKRIINKHGGKVWATGELNKGATFYFSLPQKK